MGAVNRFQYLGLMAACLVVTLPLEFVYRAEVWRRPRRLARVVGFPAVVFSLWDVAAIHHGLWRYNRRFITGWDLPGHLPVEEVVFFVVVPICSILTYQAVRATLEHDR
jgi:lycopene cyclase domain-containing protein